MKRILWTLFLITAFGLTMTACSDEGTDNTPVQAEEDFDPVDDQIDFNDSGMQTRWYSYGYCPNACGPDAACRQLTGSYRYWAACDCAPGFANPSPLYYSGSGLPIGGYCAQCASCDENATRTGGCYVEQNTTCECNEGFEGDGFTCSPSDPCAVDKGGCAEFATCTASEENTPICNCNEGFVGNGLTCDWVDPCTAAACDDNAACTSTENQPDFECTCNEGFEGDGLSCEALAVTITVNDDCTLNDAIEAANTDTAVGGCPAGNGDTDSIFIDVPSANITEATTITQDLLIEGPENKVSISLLAELQIESGVQVTMRNVSARLGTIRNHGTLFLEDFERIDADSSAIINPGVIHGTNVLFEDNNANRGGAIANTGGDLTLTNATFRNNLAIPAGLDALGGAIRGGNITITGGLFEANAVLVDDLGNCDSSLSKGAAIGGAVSVTLEDVVFINNDARGNAIISSDDIHISNCHFFENDVFYDYSCNGPSEQRFGSLVVGDGGVVNISNSSFIDNRAHVFSTRNAQIEGSTISGNKEVFKSSGYTVERSTIVDNDFLAFGAFSTVMTVRGSILSNAGGCSFGRGEIISAGYNVIVGGFSDCTQIRSGDAGPDVNTGDAGLGALTEEAGQFVLPLNSDSPAIDAGFCEVDGLTDARGFTRPSGEACDAGAYEFSD